MSKVSVAGMPGEIPQSIGDVKELIARFDALSAQQADQGKTLADLLQKAAAAPAAAATIDTAAMLAAVLPELRKQFGDLRATQAATAAVAALAEKVEGLRALIAAGDAAKAAAKAAVAAGEPVATTNTPAAWYTRAWEFVRAWGPWVFGGLALLEIGSAISGTTALRPSHWVMKIAKRGPYTPVV